MEAIETPARDLGLSEEFIADSNSVVFFKLVRGPDDLRQDQNDFNPAFSHQIFGDEEKIYGYKNLEISIVYSAACLTIFIGIHYESVASTCSPPNILKVLAEKYATPFLTNADEFEKQLSLEKSFKPFGEMLNSFSMPEYQGNPSKSSFEVYHCTSQTPGWLMYHAKLQPFILWFIDAASYIVVDDNWHFFVLYEKYISKENNQPQYAVIGYAAVYEYYAYPSNIRPRISQMLILPPFQRKGLGQKLLNSIYKHYSTMSKVLDITVEDPAEEFQFMRDYVDCSNCKALPSFAKEKLNTGYSDDMANEARERFKITKKQARRIYEILRLLHTDCGNEEQFTAYRLSVKKRLNALFQRDRLAMKVYNKLNNPTESDDDIKWKKLQSLFDALLEEYSVVVKKLKTSHENGAN